MNDFLERMQPVYKIVAVERQGHWLAWFDHFPKIIRSGTTASEAIQSLIELFGRERFETSKLQDHNGTQGGQLEFTIPLRNPIDAGPNLSNPTPSDN